MSSTRSSQLRVNATIAESVVDGPGIRYVIFVQGCPHHCVGCHNPQTHDFNGGKWVDISDLLKEIKEDPLLKGVTFSGGEPFCQGKALSELARELHNIGLDIMTYTGYTYEQLSEMAEKDAAIAALLKETDTLVDGPFMIEKRDISLSFRGSSNQRIINLKNGKPYRE